jgi:hypothetical protein
MMKKVEQSGRVLIIGATQEFGANKTRKRIVRMDASSGGMSSVIEFVLMHDNVDKGDLIKVGEDIEVTGYLMGRVHAGTDNVERCFMELQVFKIAKIGRVVL